MGITCDGTVVGVGRLQLSAPQIVQGTKDSSGTNVDKYTLEYDM